ncbi:hypothetical protein [Tsukamurella spumae]|uniref:Uncharacterized protein n=1 Tax=Tsukamurella spumae TaxID=44753 RepID=A0A846X056_9ACTN|nr:hypothetical protein [Tsukamurella spumae]NKY18868.1 hypothetical protein [Tsukamurella spumae]
MTFGVPAETELVDSGWKIDGFLLGVSGNLYNLTRRNNDDQNVQLEGVLNFDQNRWLDAGAPELKNNETGIFAKRRRDKEIQSLVSGLRHDVELLQRAGAIPGTDMYFDPQRLVHLPQQVYRRVGTAWDKLGGKGRWSDELRLDSVDRSWFAASDTGTALIRAYNINVEGNDVYVLSDWLKEQIRQCLRGYEMQGGFGRRSLF